MTSAHLASSINIDYVWPISYKLGVGEKAPHIKILNICFEVLYWWIIIKNNFFVCKSNLDIYWMVPNLVV